MSENVDILTPAPRPGEPTPALPGSERKIKAMIERATRREPLFHPQDGLVDGFRHSHSLPRLAELAGRVESA